MAQLEDFKSGAAVRGLSPEGVAKVVQVEWYSDQAVKVTFEDAAEFFLEAPRHTPRRRLDETAE